MVMESFCNRNGEVRRNKKPHNSILVSERFYKRKIKVELHPIKLEC